VTSRLGTGKTITFFTVYVQYCIGLHTTVKLIMYFLFVQDISGKAFSSSGDGKTGEICSASSAAKVFTYLQRGIKYFKRSLQNDVAFAQSAPLIIKLKLDFKNIIRDRQHGMTACPAYWPMGKNDVK
jgi:hypothetical protein